MIQCIKNLSGSVLQLNIRAKEGNLGKHVIYTWDCDAVALDVWNYFLWSFSEIVLLNNFLSIQGKVGNFLFVLFFITIDSYEQACSNATVK